ncbi:type IV toxin-antitoxin system AbiEi family antitoxin domain-containing protein [Sedimenticola sp.]|uniref:type IV toxin-antitoxin system AbiEi family antitoxin domain-containing protein n=1 Tax=Sedimenticola sp. TaxID=1940285 RepID=UPI003D1020DE
MSDSEGHKSLEKTLSEGMVVDRAWLAKRGFSRPSVDYYLRTGTLQAVARGAYRRPGPPLKWEHLVYSLQQLGHSVHVGGRSALDLGGFSHYLSMQGVKQIHLYGTDKLPSWVGKMDSPYKFQLHKTRLFDTPVPESVTTKPFGHWDWPLRYATPELALLELVAGVKQEADFETADKLFESATALRPKLVTQLLTACRQVKAKRLFLWFAERQRFSWFDRLDLSEISLGSGKRVIQTGGALDSKYQITVPRWMNEASTDGSEQPFL